MSTSRGSTLGHSQPNERQSQEWDACGGNWSKRGNWSGMNIAAMVLGFVFFWPVGLVILYWILKGRQLHELPQAVRYQVSRVFGNRDRAQSLHGPRTDNEVFNDYQQTQYDRISEIKEEIKERSRRFREFRASARRRADEEEFNRFMSDTPVTNNN